MPIRVILFTYGWEIEGLSSRCEEDRLWREAAGQTESADEGGSDRRRSRGYGLAVWPVLMPHRCSQVRAVDLCAIRCLPLGPQHPGTHPAKMTAGGVRSRPESGSGSHLWPSRSETQNNSPPGPCACFYFSGHAFLSSLTWSFLHSFCLDCNILSGFLNYIRDLCLVSFHGR